MATIFTHPAVAIGMLPWLGEVRKSKSVLIIGMLLTILPDIDVVGLGLGIPYDHLWGHRGLTHSLFFAAFTGALAVLFITRQTGAAMLRIWVYFSLCLASHGVLDAFTNGGLGVAFFSPFSNERYFFSVNPIEVSTLNIIRFFQGQGVPVLKSEIVWVWLPSLAVLITGLIVRKNTK